MANISIQNRPTDKKTRAIMIWTGNLLFPLHRAKITYSVNPFSEQFLAGLYNALKENISYVKYYSANKSNTLGHECLGLDF